jgi:hypothetical protein
MENSVGAPLTTEDQVTLIDSRINEARLSTTIFPYLLMKFVPWIPLLIPGVESALISVLIIALTILDIWFCRSTFANTLVGVTWNVEWPFSISYHFEPDPFVPGAVESNIFWFALIANFIFGIITALKSLVTLEFISLIILTLVCIVRGIDVIFYFRSLARAKKQMEATFRAVMTYTPQEFPEAEDIPPGDEPLPTVLEIDKTEDAVDFQ